MENFKSGFVSIIGRTNVGKSTLINSLVGEKVAIMANKTQTTRTAIRAIVNRKNSQIVFIDTPGIHKPNDKLGTLLNKKAYEHTEGIEEKKTLLQSTGAAFVKAPTVPRGSDDATKAWKKQFDGVRNSMKGSSGIFSTELSVLTLCWTRRMTV